MNLLVVTQVMDRNDDLLGFMQDWVLGMSKHAQKMTVICLKKGENKLPKNVEVLSLGKEHGSSRLKRIARFYGYVFQKRKQYDAVFVHMNPIYVVLGAPLWRLWGKKVSLWFAHYRVGLLLRLAHLLAHIIYTSTPYACGIHSPKVRVVGQGIDTEKFAYKERMFSGVTRVLFLGRVSPVKELEVLLDALGMMADQNWYLDIVGDPIESSQAYYLEREEQVSRLRLTDKVQFHGSVPNEKTVQFYQNADVFVNLTRSGSFDKTTLEAMSTGCIAIASNTVFLEVFPKEIHGDLLFAQSDASDLSDRLQAIVKKSSEKKKDLSQTMRSIIQEYHSVSGLTKKIVSGLQV